MHPPHLPNGLRKMKRRGFRYVVKQCLADVMGLQVPLLMFSSYFSESFKSGQAVAAPVGKN